MGLAVSEVLADTLSVSVLVDDKTVPIISLGYKAAINTAREVRFFVVGDEFVQLCHLGAKVEIKSGPDRAITNLHFMGLIREINPNNAGAEIVAMDYVTLLATSTKINYKDEDILGRDLYVLAADAMNIPEINTSGLVGGSEIRATKEMNLSGVQTRKEFIDKCFENMFKFVEDSTKYHGKLNVVRYEYAIHISNKMDIMLKDETNVHIKPSISISKNNNTIENLKARIDTTNLINSYSVTNKEDKVVFKREHLDSIKRYGLKAESVTLEIADYPTLVSIAQSYVDKNKYPSFNYVFTIRNVEHLGLGDLVEVTHPLTERNIALPISEYNLSFNEGLVAEITLGKKRFTLIETIAKAL